MSVNMEDNSGKGAQGERNKNLGKESIGQSRQESSEAKNLRPILHLEKEQVIIMIVYDGTVIMKE